MDIKQINYFVSIVEHGSFSNAARSLFITQPTLSQAIKKIEAELGTSLFLQHNNGITLSASGHLLYEEGKNILQQFDALTQKIKNLNHPPKECIRIGLPTLFAMEFMPILSKYMLSHPNVELTMVQGGSFELQQQLALDKIHLGILSFPKYEPSITISPIQHDFCGYHASVVMAENHPLATRESLTFDDLRDCAFSTLSQNFMLGKLLYDRAFDFGFSPNIVYTDNNWEVVLASVKTLGSVCIMAHEYQPYYSDKSLYWKKLVDKKSFFPIGIAYATSTPHSQTIEELIALLKQL